MKKILVVDDSASIRGLISMTLKKAGYDTVEAGDGAIALQKLKTEKSNMIISDLNMPNMNGIEFVKAVKKEPSLKFIPIVMLTTESQEEKKEEGKKAGVKAWIVKPIKPDVLLNVVKKIIG